MSLSSGDLLAVEALTRFDAKPIRTPDRWFNEAHTVGLGEELELSVLETAMVAARRLPADVAVGQPVARHAHRPSSDVSP